MSVPLKANVCPPTLWIIFVADLCEELTNIQSGNLDGFFGVNVARRVRKASARFFADDLVIYCNNKEELDASLNKINSWAERNRIDINLQKSAVLESRVD